VEYEIAEIKGEYPVNESLGCFGQMLIGAIKIEEAVAIKTQRAVTINGVTEIIVCKHGVIFG